MAQNGIATAPLPIADSDQPIAGAARENSSIVWANGGLPRARLEQALALLLESYDYAQDIGCPVWEFAVEIDAFRHLRLTSSDWRWLWHRGLVDHGRERKTVDENERAFRRGGVLRLTRRTCFVLTEQGVQLARRLCFTGASKPADVMIGGTDGAEPDLLDLSKALPVWDRDRQQLRVGRIVVKEFKLPAPNQEVVLSVFEEEGWPPRIDDPLPPHEDIDPKRRLHDTITSLNRNQKRPLIQFMGDGSGRGVRWEFSGVALPQASQESPQPR